jgi:predicted protein tyrosine phosphatase
MNLPIIVGLDDMPEVLARIPSAAVISIRGHRQTAPPWSADRANTLDLTFDDVPRDTASGYRAPRREDVERALEFARLTSQLQLVVHCMAGISRSSGIALAVLADYVGPDHESNACQHVIDAHNGAVDNHFRPAGLGVHPNAAVVQHADDILGRSGNLVRWWKATRWDDLTITYGVPAGTKLVVPAKARA